MHTDRQWADGGVSASLPLKIPLKIIFSSSNVLKRMHNKFYGLLFFDGGGGDLRSLTRNIPSHFYDRYAVLGRMKIEHYDFFISYG